MKYRRLIDDQLASNAVRLARKDPGIVQVMTAVQEAFGEIAADRALLQELFVWPHFHLVHPDRLFSILFTNKFIAHDKWDGEDLDKDRLRATVLEVSSDRPVLFVGNVGLGKTTFLKFLFQIDLCEKVVPVFVDFKGCRNDPLEIKLYVMRSLDHYLSQYVANTQGVLNALFELAQPGHAAMINNIGMSDAQDADRLRSRAILKLTSDIDNFNRIRLRYLAGTTGKKVLLIFDNVDHFENSAFIQTALSEGLAQVAMMDSCAFIMAIRDYNLGSAYQHSGFGAFQFTTIRVYHPNIDELIRQRSQYGRSRLEQLTGSDRTIQVGSARIDAATFLTFVGLLIKSLAHKDVLDVLRGISGENNRRLLRTVQTLFAAEIVRRYGRTGRMFFSRYDVIELILKAGQTHYWPPEYHIDSTVVNVFESESPGSYQNNLVRVRILEACRLKSGRGTKKEICRLLAQLGYKQELVETAIDQLVEQNLLQSGGSKALESLEDGIFYYDLSSVGRYYLEHLIWEMRYAGAMKDAIYLDEAYFRLLCGPPMRGQTFRERISAMVAAFDNFIAFQESEEAKKVRELGTSSIYSDFEKIAERLALAHSRALDLILASQSSHEEQSDLLSD